jgi:hypothetical protein
MTQAFLSHREELMIGVSIASELIDLIQDRKICPSEIRTALREVVEEEGIGHTNDFFVERVVARLR